MQPRLTNWDRKFIVLAQHFATWSKDPSTKVGAVIVDAKRRVVAHGYNGFPRGVDDSEDRLIDREAKLHCTVHAEANAILNARGSVEGCLLYATLPPCADCAKLIVQVGIARVYALAPTTEQAERWAKSFEWSRRMLDEAEVPTTILHLK